ncbi:unnamed protein product [Pleuronectes platessa]|uniref:Uncharacterized protein n=1 Tax=Pleuronectes platessa TaxID=8262 RepID=A0A9N7VK04_PLEPL|nr:unnamed protein product [Pleuronectes platessa]
MRVNIPKDNPNMACQASRPDATPVLSHHPPPPTRTDHEPRSWSTVRTQCQRDTGSATSTSISPHDTESATLDPPPRPLMRDLDLWMIKQRDSGKGDRDGEEEGEAGKRRSMCHVS